MNGGHAAAALKKQGALIRKVSRVSGGAGGSGRAVERRLDVIALADEEIEEPSEALTTANHAITPR
jgi:hypothetical protein